MKRRYFILTSLLGLLGLSTFSFIRWIRSSDQNRNLARPKFLSLLCDESTIQTLGQAYLKLRPNEVKSYTLLNDLLDEKASNIFSEKHNLSIIESQIEKRIIHDFDSDNVIVVQGWVLSITEARQCALFSILNK